MHPVRSYSSGGQIKAKVSERCGFNFVLGQLYDMYITVEFVEWKREANLASFFF